MLAVNFREFGLCEVLMYRSTRAYMLYIRKAGTKKEPPRRRGIPGGATRCLEKVRNKPQKERNDRGGVPHTYK
jgi:hypothetical protein